MSFDPDLYGPPERGNEDPGQDDDWEALLEADRPDWMVWDWGQVADDE